MMDEMQSTGCLSQVSQPSEDTTTTTTSESQASPFPSWDMFPGVSSQPRTASLTTTTLPVWTHAPPRTQTLGDASNQEFVPINPSMFPPVVTRSTSITSNPAPFFVFSASKAVSPSGQSAMNEICPSLHPLRRQLFPLAMPTKETSQNSFCLPSTTANSMFSSSPGPSTWAAPKTLPSTTASSVFSSSPGPSTWAAPKTLPSTTANSMFSSSPGPSTWPAPKTLPSTTTSSVFSSSPGPSTSVAPKTLPSTTANIVFSSSPGPSTSVAPKTLPSTTASSIFSSSPGPLTWAGPKTLPSTTASSIFSSSPGPSTSVAPKTLPSTTASSIFSSLPGPSSWAAPKTLPSTTASIVFSSLPGPSTSVAPKTLPSTTASSVFSSSPGPSTSGASKMSQFKPRTPARNVLRSVKNITLAHQKDLKFNSYPPLSTEGKNNSLPTERENNTFNSSQPASSQDTFGLRGSWFNSFKNYPKENFNSSGQSSLHPNSRFPAKFVPPIEEEGRIQSITAMAEHSSESFEEIRLEYYKRQKKTFVFDSSPFSFNTPYFFSSRNKENKQLVHKEVQTSGDNDSDTVYVKELFNEIWRILECIICLDIVKSPILQCESGHHFCNQCWSKVIVCPVCKRKKTNVRNYALESVFDKLPTSCKYHDEGCEAMVIPKDKEKHESSCCFQPFTCPIEYCTQKVYHKSLISHCVTSHDICSSVVECTLDNRSYVWNGHNAELRKYICVFNLLQWGVFLLCHKEVEHTSCIWLQLLHVNSKDSNFMYEIQLSDTENCQSVSYKGPVTRLSFNAEEAKHKCLRISSQLLFVMRNAGLEMKLEIWKKNVLPT